MQNVFIEIILLRYFWTICINIILLDESLLSYMYKRYK